MSRIAEYEPPTRSRGARDLKWKGVSLFLARIPRERRNSHVNSIEHFLGFLNCIGYLLQSYGLYCVVLIFPHTAGGVKAKLSSLIPWLCSDSASEISFFCGILHTLSLDVYTLYRVNLLLLCTHESCPPSLACS